VYIPVSEEIFFARRSYFVLSCPPGSRLFNRQLFRQKTKQTASIGTTPTPQATVSPEISVTPIPSISLEPTATETPTPTLTPTQRYRRHPRPD